MNVKYEDRYMCPSSVIVSLVRTVVHSMTEYSYETLLQKRQNTGYGDGMWDFSAAGHVEEGETCMEAASRELKEELGIDVKPDEFMLWALVHKKDRNADGREVVYYNIYLRVYKWSSEFESVRICEPDKIAEIKWVPIDPTPEGLIPDRKTVYEECFTGSPDCLTIGWDR